MYWFSNGGSRERIGLVRVDPVGFRLSKRGSRDFDFNKDLMIIVKIYCVPKKKYNSETRMDNNPTMILLFYR